MSHLHNQFVEQLTDKHFWQHMTGIMHNRHRCTCMPKQLADTRRIALPIILPHVYFQPIRNDESPFPCQNKQFVSTWRTEIHHDFRITEFTDDWRSQNDPAHIFWQLQLRVKKKICTKRIRENQTLFRPVSSHKILRNKIDLILKIKSSEFA